MDWKQIQRSKDILSRETGTIVKEWGGKISMALVYPNTYSVGMSNLGLHTIYKIANADPEVVCERFFLPEKDINGELLSIENQKRLDSFDLVAFSIPFENDYLNILPMLELAKIPFEHGKRRPVLAAGGAAVTLNPEPLARFFDLLLLGDGEESIPKLLKALKEGRDLEALHEALKDAEGFYLPGLHDLRRISTAITRTLDIHPAESVIWTRGTEFGDMHLIEIQRGCHWRCMYCAAPVIYPEFRNVSFDTIKKCIDNGLQHRKKFGLIGGDPLGHPHFEEIANYIFDAGATFSLSSLRADRISPKVAEILKRAGYKTVTIAPETGTESLRNKIGKKISNQKFVDAARNLAAVDITQLKLYFMIGLPGETEVDLDAIVELTRELNQMLSVSKKTKTLSVRTTVAIGSFVPKRGTPLEEAPFEDVSILIKKVKYLKQQLGKVPNTKVVSESPRTSEIEAMLNRLQGDAASDFLLGRWKNV